MSSQRVRCSRGPAPTPLPYPSTFTSKKEKSLSCAPPIEVWLTLPQNTPLERTDSPSLSNYKLPLAAQLGVGLPACLPLQVWVFLAPEPVCTVTTAVSSDGLLPCFAWETPLCCRPSEPLTLRIFPEGSLNLGRRPCDTDARHVI